MHNTKRMEKGIKILSWEFQEWLANLLQSVSSDLFLVYQMSDDNIIKNPFSIKINQNHTGRRFPIKKPQGYLLVDKGYEDVIAKDLVTFGLIKIRQKSYTASGLANYLILIDRLGSLPDDMKYSAIKELCYSIQIEDYEQMLHALIATFNENYHFPGVNESPLLFTDWENLLQSCQYIEPINNPIDFLRNLINFRILEIKVLEYIHALLPVPRCALIEYYNNLLQVSEESVVAFLHSNNSECTFIGALITSDYTIKPSFLGEKLASLLIIDKWEIVGKYYLRKTHGEYGNKINDELKTLFNKQIDHFLIEEFTTKAKIVTLTKFEWPSDYYAFGGWLTHIEDCQGSIIFRSNFFTELAKSFRKILEDTKNVLPKVLVDDLRPISLWFTDPFDPKVQTVSTYFNWAVLLCKEEHWNKFQKTFMDFCFEIKKLFYGSYTSNNLGLDLANMILGVLLTYPKIDKNVGKNFIRIDKLFQIFAESIGVQWVVFSERKEVIWNQEKSSSIYDDARLMYVIKRLENFPEMYLESVNRIKVTVFEEGTIKWPI
jgi:hypothetical protein